MSEPHDLFAEARERYTIFDLWQTLRLPGEPRRSCNSPFREERTPSFSIFDDGKAFKDHGSGEGGDVIEFIRVAIGGDHRAVRDWLSDRSGNPPPALPPRPAQEQQRAKVIEWPAELVTGSPETWRAFSTKARIPYAATWAAVEAGILRFCKLDDGTKCFVVTDSANRAGEIRRLDGGLFGKSKAYPLKGVRKEWLPGAAMLRGAPKSTGVFLTEGPKDYLAALGLYARYRRDHHGRNSWIPAAVLGAKCNRIDPELVPWFRSRRVRITPDGDSAGDEMAETWKRILLELGCTVDVVTMPRGKDLFDVAGEIEPEGLFR
ncbi:CHC2 zinc finger domain-containing protein [Luteolibacter marinus]|uniref:CHC2 zinc finger domain-containing protein n=1 Tax=Luteolibacter marinus TaxID=2776705 RepID=UPI0018680531|nr:CHC2 zinc finger domain-containing protein [Luteolibacter marinus]